MLKPESRETKNSTEPVEDMKKQDEIFWVQLLRALYIPCMGRKSKTSESKDDIVFVSGDIYRACEGDMKLLTEDKAKKILAKRNKGKKGLLVMRSFG